MDDKTRWRAAMLPFASTALDDLEENDRIVLMSPVDFLRLAAPVSSRIASRERTIAIRSAMTAGIALESLPFLEIEGGDQDAWIMCHNGRHRAMELRDLGHAVIPVVMTGTIVDLDRSLGTVLHAQPHDDEDDYPGHDDESLEERMTPMRACDVVLSIMAPETLRALLGSDERMRDVEP